jgi:hypothetical protein
MDDLRLKLRLLPEQFAICKLAAEAEVPAWAAGGSFSSATRTPTELTIICDQSRVPDDITAERGWKFLGVEGPISFEAIGVIAALALPLARARVSIIVVASCVTDYIVVPAAHLATARAALEAAGHTILT